MPKPSSHLRTRALFASGVLLGGATIAGVYAIAAATATAVAATFIPAVQVQEPRAVALTCDPDIARTGSRPRSSRASARPCVIRGTGARRPDALDVVDTRLRSVEDFRNAP